jgi:hypothetical protein
MNGAPRFADTKIFPDHRFALGRDSRTGGHYLSIPVSNRLVDYEEYYRLEPELYARILTDDHAAAAFAVECRAREHDNRLILRPGRDRGTA